MSAACEVSMDAFHAAILTKSHGVTISSRNQGMSRKLSLDRDIESRLTWKRDDYSIVETIMGRCSYIALLGSMSAKC